MKHEVEFAELHTPLFLGGKNHGSKLDPAKTGGLKLAYDLEKDLLFVEFGKKVAIIKSNWASINLKDPRVLGMEETIEAPKPKDTRAVATHKSHPMKKGIASAQVQTPTGHVFQGEGSGQTGK